MSRELGHNKVLVVVIYVPKNNGLAKFTDRVRQLVKDPQFEPVRGEDISLLVDRTLGFFGWTGNDLFEDYCASGKGKYLRVLEFMAWPEIVKPSLCLLGPEQLKISDYSVLLRSGKIKIAVPSKYQNLARKYFELQKWSPEIIVLGGELEKQIRLGVADLVLDIVQSGQSAQRERLCTYQTIFSREKAGLVLITKDI